MSPSSHALSAASAVMRARTFVARSTNSTNTYLQFFERFTREKVGVSRGVFRSFLHRHLPWAAAYGLVLGASAALNTVYVLYSLELFTSSAVARLTPTLFYLGQTMYMLWNAVNDPLFGWLSDKSRVKRTDAIRYGGFLWCVSFLWVWFPFSSPSSFTASSIITNVDPSSSTSLFFSSSPLLAGIHFVLSTCLYDGALTYVELNHAALLSEAVVGQAHRAQANAWSAAAAAAGSGTSFIAHALWKSSDLSEFRSFVIVLSVLSCLVFQIAATRLETDGRSAKQHEKEEEEEKEEDIDSSITTTATTNSKLNAPLERKTGIELENRVQQDIPVVVGGGIQDRESVVAEAEEGRRPHKTLGYVPPSSTSSSSSSTVVGIVSPPTEYQVASPATMPIIEQQAEFTHEEINVHPASSSSSSSSSPSSSSSSSSISFLPSYRIFLTQLLSQRNFVLFAVIGALQSFDCRFEKNFFAPFLAVLVGSSSEAVEKSGRGEGLQDPTTTSLSSSTSSTTTPTTPMIPHAILSISVSLSFLLPHAITILVTPWIARIGLAAVIQRVFVLRAIICGVGIVLFTQWNFSHFWSNSSSNSNIGSNTQQTSFLAPPSPAICLLFMLANRVTSEAVCRLSPLVGADIVDEDMYLYRSNNNNSNNNNENHKKTGITGGIADTVVGKPVVTEVEKTRRRDAKKEASGDGEDDAEDVALEVSSSLSSTTMTTTLTKSTKKGRRISVDGAPPPTSAAALLGALSFASRVAQSLAPMLGYSLLQTRSSVWDDSSRSSEPSSSSSSSSSLSSASSASSMVWGLLLLVPIVTVAIQLSLWRKYTLRGEYLSVVKDAIVRRDFMK